MRTKLPTPHPTTGQTPWTNLYYEYLPPLLYAFDHWLQYRSIGSVERVGGRRGEGGRLILYLHAPKSKGLRSKHTRESFRAKLMRQAVGEMAKWQAHKLFCKLSETECLSDVFCPSPSLRLTTTQAHFFSSVLGPLDYCICCYISMFSTWLRSTNYFISFPSIYQL